MDRFLNILLIFNRCSAYEDSRYEEEITNEIQMENRKQVLMRNKELLDQLNKLNFSSKCLIRLLVVLE